MKTSEKRRFISWILFFIFLTIVGFYFDSRVAVSMQYLRTSFLTSFFLNFGSSSTVAVLVIILTAVFFQQKKKEKILPLWFAAALSVVASFVLKVIVQRPRPFQLGLIKVLGSPDIAYSTWDFSFPSFHTMAIFATLPFLDKEFPKFRYVWIALAIIIGFSRMYLGVHFLSDVLSGGLIGYVIGKAIVESEKENGFWGRTYKKIFVR